MTIKCEPDSQVDMINAEALRREYVQSKCYECQIPTKPNVIYWLVQKCMKMGEIKKCSIERRNQVYNQYFSSFL